MCAPSCTGLVLEHLLSFVARPVEMSDAGSAAPDLVSDDNSLGLRQVLNSDRARLHRILVHDRAFLRGASFVEEHMMMHQMDYDEYLSSSRLLNGMNLEASVPRGRSDPKSPRPKLAKVDVRTFASVVYSAEGGTASQANVECSICLHEFADGQKLKRVPCGGNHMFHDGCAAQWFQDHSTCPLCRKDLRFLPLPRARTNAA